MKTAFSTLVIMFLSALAFAAPAVAQDTAVEKCGGRIYEPKEVAKHPKFGFRPTPNFTAEALAHNVRGRVVLSAVLCRTGRVTDIQVVEGLPDGMTEKAVEAARQIKFEPAEKDGYPVSEVIRLEYDFHYVGERRPPAKEPIAGRMIEALEISGLRSKHSDEIMAYLRTRPGESYSQEQVTADLQSLLAVGFFDPKETKVRVEEGFRGGVIVVFELTERKPK